MLTSPPPWPKGRTEEVSYKIDGHGSGWYLRVAGMPIIGLVRYDTREPHFPRGSILIPRHHPQWRPHEPADRNRWLGSEDPGDPITRKTAEQCIVGLGLPITKLDELRMPFSS